ncbi:MAG TPA: RHS repeat-associated core domain-containing protein [Fimbriimonadaceae bacterium]|nr:RHS repeat-associated core domain-containing protein [Fimbriimonadaceae bacterium]
MALSVRVSNMNGEIVGEKRGGQHRVLTSDPQGNVIDVRDSSGTQLASYNYWPYGGLRTSTGSIVNPWRYSGAWGAYFDGASYYIRARVFRPDLTRWMTVDPWWLLERIAFSYCFQNPLRYVDPTGKKPGKDKKKNPCAKFLPPTPVISAPWDSPCGKIFVPSGLKWPPTKGDKDAFECWMLLIQDKVPKRCIPGMAGDFGYFQGKNWFGASDKYIHCVLGCIANEFFGSCCALYLSLWLEMKPYPPGNQDPEDVLATLEGSKCAEAEDSKVPAWCRWIPPLNDLNDLSIHEMCTSCCSKKHKKGVLGK